MLLADFGKPIGHKASPKVRQGICRLFAQIQIQTTKHHDHLLATGCLDRLLEVLQSQIEPLVKDENTLSGLSVVEVEHLQMLVPTLKNLCDQLNSYHIPATLVHGDLHLNNVALHKGNYIFFDWTDSCIAHPFFDLFSLLNESNHRSFLGRLNRLWTQKARDEYLNQWRPYETRERLLDAWKIARPLAALHNAVTYQSMRHGLETRCKQEVARIIPYLLQYVVNCREDL